VVHEEVLAFFRKGEVRRALAAEAVAHARVEVAARGLNATVIQNYFAIISAQRKFANAQTALQEARRFYEISQQLEKGGEAAHSDVIKAEIDLRQRQREEGHTEGMARRNIYLSDDLDRRAREARLNVSDVCQVAIGRALT